MKMRMALFFLNICLQVLRMAITTIDDYDADADKYYDDGLINRASVSWSVMMDVT